MDDITSLLQSAADGDRAAFERVMPLVIDELHRQAEIYMQRERVGHTLQPTALVNETFLRLVREKGVPIQNRRHFFAIAAQRMREILINYAHRRNAQKRGGGRRRYSLDELADAEAGAELDLSDVVALDEALRSLESSGDERVRRMARMVEFRLFAGLTTGEIATELDVSTRTVERELKAAVSYLLAQLEGTTKT